MSLYRRSDSSKKWQISVFSAFIFIVVIPPYTYLCTQKVLGGLLGKLADSFGSPNLINLQPTDFLISAVELTQTTNSIEYHVDTGCKDFFKMVFQDWPRHSM
jgi:hypothetical protein